jgi:hypothetical protein
MGRERGRLLMAGIKEGYVIVRREKNEERRK